MKTNLNESLVSNCVCVFGCVWAVSACPVRCSRGRTIAPTPVGEALMPSRGRQLHRSSRALSSGTRPSLRRRRPKSQARQLPSSPQAPRGRSAALTLLHFVFLCWVCSHTIELFKLLFITSLHLWYWLICFVPSFSCDHCHCQSEKVQAVIFNVAKGTSRFDQQKMSNSVLISCVRHCSSQHGSLWRG